MSIILKLVTVKCGRCKYEWPIRKETLPKQCPKCWSRRWNAEPNKERLPFDA